MFLSILAQTGSTSPSASSGGGLGSIAVLLPLIAVFYFLMIRPQSRARKQQASLVQSIAVGDEIETAGGLYGTVRRMDDTTMLIEFSPGNAVKVARGAVRRKVITDLASENGPE